MQGIVSAATQSTVYVVATDDRGTRAALRAANPLALGSGARLVVLVPQVVPYPLSIEPPTEPGRFLATRFRDLAVELDCAAQIRLCLCRRAEDVVRLLTPAATVVLGGAAGRWWPTPTERMARRLSRLGHHVVLASSGDDRALAPEPSPVACETIATSRRGQFTALAAMLGVLTAPHIARAQTSTAPQDAAPDAPTEQAPAPANLLDGVVFGIGFDGYYAWNTNQPIGRVNLLRAYDVSSNSFSVNQANVILERGLDVDKGRRAGLRLDLMFGQATETLQGSAANEPRPQVYRQLFQAYGSYLFPVGKGLQLDFGKFASALGFENNYTKDQVNYSRSYYFNFLPFYHMGVRSTYTPSERLSLTYWLVNGAQQTEDFNGFKSQAAIVTIKPVPSVSWNLNYYNGREARDLNPSLNPGLPSLPTQPGLSVDPAAADGARLHIFDTYASWTKGKATLAIEGDYVALKPQAGESAVVAGGAAYAQYRVTTRTQAALRYEYLDDRAGLFSGVVQTLQDVTATATYQLDTGFQLRGEWRRDSSDHAFFLGRTVDDRRNAQQTLTAALVWWFGTKQGSW